MIAQIFELFRSFFLIGLGAYGGGTVVIPLIEQEIVLKHSWLTGAEFAQLISLSQMTPGPIAINAATFVGFLRGGLLGSLAATFGIIAPSLILMTIIIHLLKCYRDNCHIDRIRKGVRPGVLALIILAIVSVGKTAVYNHTTIIISLVTFLVLYYFKKKINPIFAILLAGIAGLFVL